MDQITYNRKLRSGGLIRLPIGIGDDGIEYSYLSLYEPRLEREEVREFLRELFQDKDSQEWADSGKKCEQAGNDLRAAAMSTGAFLDGSACGCVTPLSWWYWSGIRS